MRSVQLTEFGTDNLAIVEQERPAAGPGEVVVRVRAASINNRDFQICQGWYKPDLALPLVPLSDGAGEVVETGAGVSAVAAGDRVASVFWQSWPEGAPTIASIGRSTGCEAPGMATEYALLPEAAVTKIPAGMNFAQAATLPCAAVTAWRALTVLCGTRPGDLVLLLGTGGVSLFALQFAKALGATVAITSGSDDKLARARELGADHVINYRSNPEWGAEVFQLGKPGADVVIETAGAGTLAQSLGALAWDGHLAYIGALAGMSAEMSLLAMVAKNAHLHGITVGSRQDQLEMIAFMEKHGIEPVIDRTFGFDEAPQAIPAIAAGQHFGKLVVTLD